MRVGSRRKGTFYEFLKLNMPGAISLAYHLRDTVINSFDDVISKHAFVQS
jgi:hypothetical protein